MGRKADDHPASVRQDLPRRVDASEMDILEHLEAALMMARKHWGLASAVVAMISVLLGSVVYLLEVVVEERTARVQIDERLEKIKRTHKHELELMQRKHESDMRELSGKVRSLAHGFEQGHLRLVREICRAIEGTYEWDRDSRSAECLRRGDFYISIEIP